MRSTSRNSLNRLTADTALDRPNNTTTPPLQYSQAAGNSPHLASRPNVSINRLRKPEHCARCGPCHRIESGIKLNVLYASWHAPCGAMNHMAIIRPICPISTRLASKARRRIAPVAPTSRVTGRGARSSSGTEQPAQHHGKTKATRDTYGQATYKATFVSQVLGQQTTRHCQSPTQAAAQYESTERIDAMKWQWLSTRL